MIRPVPSNRAPAVERIASVTIVAGTLPSASRRTTFQSTVPPAPWTAVPADLVAAA